MAWVLQQKRRQIMCICQKRCHPKFSILAMKVYIHFHTFLTRFSSKEKNAQMWRFGKLMQKR